MVLGGANEARTRDLLNAIQALSQLSYNPKISLHLFYHTLGFIATKNINPPE